jgi:predicted alpha/beta hydrolase family esterase
MKKVFLIHGWGGYPEEGWFPWLKASLEKEGFEVLVPEMPDTNNPQIDKWIDCLQKIVGSFDQDVYFVGHSIGCQAILRFLEISENEKSGGVIMVAPWIKLFELETAEENKIAARWEKSPIDFEKVKNKAERFFAIFSDNDPCVPLEGNIETFREKLGAEIIIEKNKRHFAGDDGICELPVVLDIIRKL